MDALPAQDAERVRLRDRPRHVVGASVVVLGIDSFVPGYEAAILVSIRGMSWIGWPKALYLVLHRVIQLVST